MTAVMLLTMTTGVLSSWMWRMQLLLALTTLPCCPRRLPTTATIATAVVVDTVVKEEA
jgi:hypothetical protein